MERELESPKTKQKDKKKYFDKIVAWLHLWPSLVSGIILVFVCLTGTIIVYGDEIMDWTAGDAKYVTPAATRVSSIEINDALKKAYPEAVISEYVFFKDPARSIRLRVFFPKERKLTFIYMNPYTGEVLKKDGSIYFFYVTAHLHAELLAGPVGSWTVAIATIIFVLSCITGLILWWPKRWTRATRQASFTIKWKAKFKRLNYDLHNVYGFYSLTLCLVLGVTGLLIFSPKFASLTMNTLGIEQVELRDALPKIDSAKQSHNFVPIAYEVLAANPQKSAVNIWNSDTRKMGAYIFTTGKMGLKSVENAQIHIYDRYTGKKIEVEKNLLEHDIAENTVWQLHLGQWWGQFGKFSTFLAGLVATSLPITGFLIWWGRRNKKSLKQRKQAINKKQIPENA